MAAEIQSERGNTRKPQLINKIDNSIHKINQLRIIPNENGIITANEDRTVQVWLKRDTGQYWPSVCQTMPSPASSLDYYADTQRVMVGLDNGTISEFKMAEDFNRMTHVRDYLAHRGRVTAVEFTPQSEWVLSCARDKFFQWHCAQTGRRLGGHQVEAWCLCLSFDAQSGYAFVGDYSGQIHVLKVSDNTVTVITVLKGHSGSVQCLAWDAEKSLLCSGSFDKSIVVWDIGGQRGTAFELQGHHDKVQALLLVPQSRQLLSTGDDTLLSFWDMAASRNETPEWQESDMCQLCGDPFFWNFRSMWDKKTVGVRQHHCRKCGKAVCANCSTKRSTLPIMGYEYDIRVCDLCYDTITDSDRAPLATFHDVRHQVVTMDLDLRKKLLVTAGSDRVIKDSIANWSRQFKTCLQKEMWDVSSVLH